MDSDPSSGKRPRPASATPVVGKHIILIGRKSLTKNLSKEMLASDTSEKSLPPAIATLHRLSSSKSIMDHKYVHTVENINDMVLPYPCFKVRMLECTPNDLAQAKGRPHRLLVDETDVDVTLLCVRYGTTLPEIIPEETQPSRVWVVWNLESEAAALTRRLWRYAETISRHQMASSPLLM